MQRQGVREAVTNEWEQGALSEILDELWPSLCWLPNSRSCALMRGTWGGRQRWQCPADLRVPPGTPVSCCPSSAGLVLSLAKTIQVKVVRYAGQSCPCEGQHEGSITLPRLIPSQELCEVIPDVCWAWYEDLWKRKKCYLSDILKFQLCKIPELEPLCSDPVRRRDFVFKCWTLD